MILFREETAEQMRERIRAEIEAENKARLADPRLYLNHPKRLDGSLHEAEREQIHSVIPPAEKETDGS